MTLKDSKHWSTKSEAARDEVRDAVEETVDWLIVRRREVGYALGGAAVLALIVGLFLYSRHARISESWDKLSQAELLAYSGRPADAQKLLGDVAAGGGSAAAASLADMMDGDLHYPNGEKDKAEFDKALASYDKAAAEAPEPLRPFAQADRVMTLLAAGRFADCAASAQAFLDANGESMMAAQVHTDLARCQLAQRQPDAAKATLQRIVLQYPATPWAEWAQYKVAQLGK